MTTNSNERQSTTAIEATGTEQRSTMARPNTTTPNRHGSRRALIKLCGTVSAAGDFGHLTVTNTHGVSDLIHWPHGAPQPMTNTINHGPVQTVASECNVGLSTSGAMDLLVHVSGTDVIIAIAGYAM